MAVLQQVALLFIATSYRDRRNPCAFYDIGPTHAARALTFGIEPRYRIRGGAAIRVAPGASTWRLLSIGLAVVDVAVGVRRRAIALLHAALVGIPAPVYPVVWIRFEDVIHIARVDFATRDLAEEMEDRHGVVELAAGALDVLVASVLGGELVANTFHRLLIGRPVAVLGLEADGPRTVFDLEMLEARRPRHVVVENVVHLMCDGVKDQVLALVVVRYPVVALRHVLRIEGNGTRARIAFAEGPVRGELRPFEADIGVVAEEILQGVVDDGPVALLVR